MTGKIQAIDSFAGALAEMMIRMRWLVILLAVLATAAIGQQAQKLEFSNDYRDFFSEKNPELKAFKDFQDTYTQGDNFFFVVLPKNGALFSPETLEAVAALTEEAWQIPYARRVDSLTNFQYTYAIGDDLIVEDFIDDPFALSPPQLETKRALALAEPLLRDQLITSDGSVTAVNVAMQYPELSLTEIPEAAAAAREIRAAMEQAYPDIDIILTGTSMLSNAFPEAIENDLGSLIPLMFVIIMAATFATIRSPSATAATLLLIIFSTIVAMGYAGAAGIKLTGPSPMAPVVILTLAIADSIHILISMRSAMRDGVAKREAIVEAIRINFLPVGVTSLTTIVGFLSLRLSDSPPFRDFGTIAAVGIFAAWVFSITLLPALLSFTKMRITPRAEGEARGARMLGFANIVIRHYRLLFVSAGAIAAALIAFIPTMELSDQFREYFAPRIEFRAESDRALEYFGFYTNEYSINSGEPGGVSDPDFLKNVEAFASWLRAQPDVTHVYAITDIMKRLNKNLNGDNPDYYRLPDDRELSAQYLLLYELSLPYGLDLNDRINIDKSATRITVTIDGRVSTQRVRQLKAQAENWFDENAPALRTSPTGAQIMFTFIAQRNVETMIVGTAIAIVAIALIMMLTLRSVSMGLISLVPNALPILTTFGVWALLFGEVGFSVAAIAAISLGIVIDDTVHFLAKFTRARREMNLSHANSIRYAFETVGVAIIVNTLILTAGFLVMTQSAFKINMELGLLTSMTIVIALILDFLFLPALLLIWARFSGERIDWKGDDYVRHSFASEA